MYSILSLSEDKFPKDASKDKPFDITISVVPTDAAGTVQVVAIEGKPVMPVANLDVTPPAAPAPAQTKAAPAPVAKGKR